MLSFRTNNPSETIARTGFYVSVLSYIMFWLADTVRPGFVARYFSVHIFLIAILFFALWWSRSVENYVDRPIVQRAVAALLGVGLAMLVWNVGKGLVGFRFLTVALALFTPTILLRLIRNK